MLHFFYGYAGNTDFFYSYIGFFYARLALAALPLSGELVFLFHSYVGFHTGRASAQRQNDSGRGKAYAIYYLTANWLRPGRSPHNPPTDCVMTPAEGSKGNLLGKQ